MARRNSNLGERLANEEPKVSWADRIWSLGSILSDERKTTMRNGYEKFTRTAGHVWDVASEYAWATTISFVVMVLPLAIEVDRDQQMADLEANHSQS